MRRRFDAFVTAKCISQRDWLNLLAEKVVRAFSSNAGDMARFAIVHWEDHFVSLINLETVKEPRKPVLEYREGEFITATYGKKPYKARISEISSKYMHS